MLSDLDTFPDLLGELERWRVRAARGTGKARVSLRDLAAATGLPHSSLANYLSGATTMPADVLDTVVLALGAGPAEVRQWAQAWERASVGRTRHASSGHDRSRSRSPGVVPRQLPGAVGRFVGRVNELRMLTERMESLSGAGGTVVVSAIDGTAGIGKTALAVHFAHQVADRFPDGQLYVNLRGFDPGGTPLRPAEVVRGFLHSFQVPLAQVPADPDAQTSLYRSLVADKRVLVVLDNARDAAQVRSLLPGGPSCLTLVTSRNQLTPLVVTDGAHPLTLDLLSVEEARALLERHLGADRLAAAPEAVDALITLCARLPLALSITAARASSRPSFPLASLVEELSERRTRLAALDVGDPLADVRAVFSWSYRNLTPPAARVFRRLGSHPGPDISVPATASLAGIPAARARLVLAEFAHAHLLTEHLPGRYTFHDLLRVYAAEQADAEDSEAEQQAAVHRMLSHYLHTTCTAAVLIDPHRDSLPLPAPPDGCAPESLEDHEGALAWLDTERPVLLSAISRAAETQHARHCWLLAWSVASYLERRGFWQERTNTQRIALDVSLRAGEREGQAHCHKRLGGAHVSMGSLAEADQHLRRAVVLFEELDDHTGVSRTMLDLVRFAARQGDNAAALAHAHAALDRARRADNVAVQAMALNAAGWLEVELGDPRAGLEHAQEALEVSKELGALRNDASTLDTCGYAHHRLGQLAEAASCYQRAADYFEELGDRHQFAQVLDHLAQAQLDMGEVGAARLTWQHTLDLLVDLGLGEAEAIRLKLDQLNG